MSNSAVTLYRKALRECKKFPLVELQNKLHHNVRELFEIHRAETDPGALAYMCCSRHVLLTGRCSALLAAGKEDLATLRLLARKEHLLEAILHR